LTLALLTGFVFVTDLWISICSTKPFCRASLGHLRRTAGRQDSLRLAGRASVSWTLSGFGFLLLSYFGSKFVLEYLLGRHWG